MSYADPSPGSPASLDGLTSREWIVPNGLGGYASSTSAGMNTRKYHGLLVAAMAPPVRRMVLLSRVEESVIARGWPHELACSEYPGTVHPEGYRLLRHFERWPHPCWTYQGEGWTLQKELFLLDGQNTVCLRYTLLAARDEVVFELRPLLALRPIHELTYQRNADLDAQDRPNRNLRIPPTSRTPEVFIAADGMFCGDSHWYLSTIYRQEEMRGYAGLEDLWNPGLLRWRLCAGQSACFVCSADPIDLPAVKAATAPELVKQAATIGGRTDPLSQLHRGAEHFAVASERVAAGAGKGCAGGRGINLITQFPWDPPDVRDALIAMTGVFLIPANLSGAKALLAGLMEHEKDGLLPSVFPEDGSAPLYLGADVSLWLIHAVGQYLRYGGDESWVSGKVLDTLIRIISRYRDGTGLGICMGDDGLLTSASPGMGTSWMNARVNDWVVTPRGGQTVELNALWYNALCAVSELAGHAGRTRLAVELSALAGSVKASFNKRFWNEMAQCCFDVIDEHGFDAAIRPNQIFAVSLPHAVLEIERHAKVIEKVRAELLTPVGLRTLGRSDAKYQGHYRGDVIARDRALHQGSIFPWLMGAYTDAWLRLNGRSPTARQAVAGMLEGILKHLDEHDSICELFDGDVPHHPGGSPASAAAVGEILRAYTENVLDRAPVLPTRPAADARLWPDRPAARKDSPHEVP